MSRKLTAFMVGVLGLFTFAVGSMQGCGGSSGSGMAANCSKFCDKAMACTPGSTAMDKTTCVMQCNAQTMGLHCSNQAAINSAVDNCAAMSDCTAAMNCFNTVPDCQQTTGTAGTGGGGTGTAGTGGGGTGGGGTWSCQDDSAGMTCACAMGAGGPLASCPTSYNCCVQFSASGTPGCGCTTFSATADCTTFAGLLMGTKVSRCPPP